MPSIYHNDEYKYRLEKYPPRWNHTLLSRDNLYDMAGAARAKQGPRIKKEGKGDLYRIGGVDLPWDPELDLDKPKPTPLYPAFQIPKPKPLTEKEKSQVAHFRQLRESIKNGPLYTVLGDNVRVGKPGTSAAAAFNPFEGMPKYSQRYTKKKRMIPKLDTRPYVLKFFPKELWSTIDPTATETNGVINTDTKGKSLQLSGYEKDADMSEDEMDVKEERDPDDEDMPEGEEVDDEFDDEEDGGDYNAEQYFDDGGDDAGDDYDAGGDEGAGTYYD